MHTPKRKLTAILLVIIILVIAAAGAAFGYLSADSDQVSNTLTPATDPDPTIIAATKAPAENDSTQPPEYEFSVNIGTLPYAVYVRAAIVITWQNSAGEVYGEIPISDTDYTMDWNDSDWFLRDSDGFYYHRAMVTSNSELAKLVNSVSVKEDANAPDGYSLHVEIVAQTIQARGTTDDNDILAVTDAWGVTVDSNGNLSP